MIWGEIPFAAPLMGKGGDTVGGAVDWDGGGVEGGSGGGVEGGGVSLEAWKEVREWFWDDGDGDRGGKLAGNASRGPGPKRG